MFIASLRQQAESTPDRVAIRAERGGTWRTWTCAQVWDAVRRAAGRLQGIGVAPGDRVALYADNSPEWALAYLGIHAAGGVVVPLDAQYSDRELRTLVSFAEARVMLCSRSTRDKALVSRERAEQPDLTRGRGDAGTRGQRLVGNTEVAKAAIPLREGGLDHLLCIDDPPDLFDAPPSDRIVARERGDLMALIFTSGTTGDPKGVRLTTGNIASNVEAVHTLGLLRPTDVVLSLLPLHHCYALTVSVLVPLTGGGAITFCPSLRGPDILKAMVETGVTVTPGVPKLFEGFDRTIQDRVRKVSPWKQRLFRSLKVVSHKVRRWTGWNPGRLLFRSIHRMFGPAFRFFVSGGAKLDAEIAERLLDLGVRVVEGYGLTETSPVLTFNPPRRIKPGTVGMPLPGVEIKIEAPDAAGMGEIIVRGPNVMEGYDRRPEDTAQVIRDGWFHTGDLGFFDKEGYLHITGRAKEVIVLASGKNIYPDEVERAYEQSPLVKEVCVMPVERPDSRVDRLCAIVAPDFDELRRRKAVSAHAAIRQQFATLSQSLPSYMRVNEIKLVANEFPRTRLGKLRRAEIRKMALQEVDASAPVTLSQEDRDLLAAPGAGALIERIKGLTQHEGEVLPGDHLELDLGLDSLMRVELDVILERDFGVKVPPEEAPNITTVGDLLRRLSGEQAGASRRDWRAILSDRADPPLAEMFNLRPSRWTRDTLSGLRRLALRVAQRTMPLDVRGLENLPRRGPYLLCPTHASLLDAVLVYIGLPDDQRERMFFLGAQEFFASRLMRWAARIGHVIPTATSDTVLVSLQRAAEALQMGCSVCIFPEGAITRDGCLQRPRPGAGILSCEFGVPVVPLLVRGTYTVLSYTHPGFRFTPVGLTFGKPISPPPRPGEGVGRVRPV